MNAYEAIMKAADSIEQNPGLFDFYKTEVPPCGSPGCLIGLIGQLMGGRAGENVGAVCQNILSISDRIFYDRMSDIWRESGLIDRGFWNRDAPIAAACLRLYAEKYHPNRKLPVKYEGIPAETLAIFERATA